VNAVLYYVDDATGLLEGKGNQTSTYDMMLC